MRLAGDRCVFTTVEASASPSNLRLTQPISRSCQLLTRAASWCCAVIVKSRQQHASGLSMLMTVASVAMGWCRYVMVEYGPMELDLNLRVRVWALQQHLAAQKVRQGNKAFVHAVRTNSARLIRPTSRSVHLHSSCHGPEMPRDGHYYTHEFVGRSYGELESNDLCAARVS